MLGRALCQELSDKYEVVGLDIATIHDSPFTIHKFMQCDITDRKKTIAAIDSIKPDMVIHAAAYTDVDGCERNSEKAHRVNALGTETIALACHKCSASLCYISTDFVFDGEKKTPYTEEDAPKPINSYGKSKFAGEKVVQSILEDFIIIRSSWLFGKGGRNFVDMLLKQAQNEKRLEVVNDQFGSPTCTKDFAQTLGRLVGLSDRLSGIYHITNSSSCSRYEFALAIKEIANLDANIIPVSTERYRSPTRRPKMSILENRRYQELTGGAKLRHWKEALEEYLLEVERHYRR